MRRRCSGWSRPCSGLEETLGTEPAALADFLAASKDLPDRVADFFDAVLVMDPDVSVRADRLGLLHGLARVADRVLDWSAL